MDKCISIIMATYNCEKTVEKAIDSILAQTYDDWVMIICDDGSSDRTLEILHRYAEDYPGRFLILRNEENKKLPYSLNRCIRAAKTELIARMDGDDWCHPERLQKQIDYLMAHPEVDLVGTGVSVWNGEKQVSSIIKTPYPTPETMTRANAFSHATIMTYKRVYDALGGYDEDPMVLRVEDVDLWCRFLAAGFQGYNLPDELYMILEDDNAAKRRTFRARLNSARTRNRGYRLMGFRGWVCIKPYLIVLKAFVPIGIYRKIHVWKLNHSDEMWGNIEKNSDTNEDG